MGNVKLGDRSWSEVVNIDNNIILGSYKCDFFGYSIFALFARGHGCV
jgi:hypothetical protein